MWRSEDQVATPTAASAAVGGVTVAMVKGIGHWNCIEGTGGGRFMRDQVVVTSKCPCPSVAGCNPT